jgi:hypothetical protein
MISSNMKRAAVVALQSSTALASAHLAVMMYLAHVCFPGEFIGPTKSMSHFSNAYKVSWGANGMYLLWTISQVFGIHHRLYSRF